MPGEAERFATVRSGALDGRALSFTLALVLVLSAPGPAAAQPRSPSGEGAESRPPSGEDAESRPPSGEGAKVPAEPTPPVGERTDDDTEAAVSSADAPGRLGTEDVERCPPSDAPAASRKARAADHYDRGLVLYEEGDYARAIDEFVASYCDQAHPSAFYNIGQSYERLLDYERAVAYFERYIRETDPNDPNRRRAALRVEVFKRQPARITVATSPPGATVTLSGATGVNARGRANSEQPILALKGRYTMKIDKPGHQPIAEEINLQIGQPYSYYYRLEPERGFLRVSAAPRSARIFLDNKLVGIGNYSESVPVGRYELVVEAEGRAPERRDLEVFAGQSADESVALASPPASGRRALIIGSSLGLGVMGSAVLTSVLGGDPKIAGLAGLAGLGIGFGGAYLGVPATVTRPQAWSVISGGVIGATGGLIVGTLAGCSTSESEFGIEESCSGDPIGGGLFIGTIAGALGGAWAATALEPSAGDLALVDSGALWGTATGALFLAIFDADARIREAMLLSGLTLGLVTGATLAARADVSTRRIALVDLAGLAGLVGGFAVAQTLTPDSEQQTHFTLAGMGIGLIAGTFLTRHIDEPAPRQGSLRPALGAAEDAAGAATPTVGLGVTW